MTTSQAISSAGQPEAVAAAPGDEGDGGKNEREFHVGRERQGALDEQNHNDDGYRNRIASQREQTQGRAFWLHSL
jgi:hypothetical protein